MSTKAFLGVGPIQGFAIRGPHDELSTIVDESLVPVALSPASSLRPHVVTLTALLTTRSTVTVGGPGPSTSARGQSGMYLWH